MGDLVLPLSGDCGALAAAAPAGGLSPSSGSLPASPARLLLLSPPLPSHAPRLAPPRAGGLRWADVWLAEAIACSLPVAPSTPSFPAARAGPPRCTTFPTTPRRWSWGWPPGSWGPGFVLGGGRTSGPWDGGGFLAAHSRGSVASAAGRGSPTLCPVRWVTGVQSFVLFAPLMLRPTCFRRRRRRRLWLQGKPFPPSLGLRAMGWADAGHMVRQCRGISPPLLGPRLLGWPSLGRGACSPLPAHPRRPL